MSDSITLDAALEPFPYQLEILDYLKSEERDLWAWFASAKFLEAFADSVRLELLKASYRFDATDHPRLYELVHAARETLGLDAPVTIYQSTDTRDMNASLAFVPGEIHIVLHGAVTSLLTEEELQSALAHELTHHALWTRFDGELLVAYQLLGAVADHPGAAASHIESARLFSLYNEIHADRGSLFATKDVMPAIRSLIKIQTGLAEVHAESYLRQADEIFSRERVKTKQLTHPESFIRARALRDWAERGREAFGDIARMIEGETELSSLDLAGQVRISRLTRSLIAGFLAPKWLQTDAVLAHARKFFPDLQPASALDDDTCRAIAAAAPSVQQYLGYVLLDFVVADPELEDVPVAAVIDVADRCGIKDQIVALLGKEIALTKKRLAKVEQERAHMLAAAAKQAEAAP